jgi:hypothetical protein
MNRPFDANDRKAFVLERMKIRSPSLGGEILWAVGMVTLPEGERPPDWVKSAILRLSRELPVQLEFVKSAADVTPEIRGTIAGLAAAGSLSITTPTEQEKAEEEKNPYLKEFREMFKPLAEGMKAAESELDKTPPKLGVPMSPLDVGKYHEGGRNAAEFVSEQAEMSMKAELCFWLWILWPDVKDIGSRAKTHQWYAGMRFVSCSFKLFEKVCQEIGFRPSE